MSEAVGEHPDSVSRLGCDLLVRRFLLDPTLASHLVDLDRWMAERVARADPTGRLRWQGLTVISGHRSRSLQAEINPLAPRSLHTRCPALAVDLRVGNKPASTTPVEVWALLGQRWKLTTGGRWGGDFRSGCKSRLGEICVSEANHFDLPGSPFEHEHQHDDQDERSMFV